jgi:saccharopine dehydrogenase-like NADP-dependent oxidoreductase
MRTVVLGGYGNFGARICRALAAERTEVIAAGRDPERGHREAGFGDNIDKARLDVADPQLTENLRTLSPGIVIHCAGPFQGQDYRVALASLAAGAHYIDLADGRSFVTGFTDAVDPAARAAGLLAVTGASTLPALSSAVVDMLKGRFAMLDEIQLSIAPAQRSPRGTATLQAVFSYVGKPFNWMEEGTWQIAYGWQELCRLRFADLGMRWAAACDVPDLELLPARYPGTKTVQFRAALEFGVEHLLLATVAGFRRLGIRVPMERWAAPLDRLATKLDRFGGERGGMLVSLIGVRADGQNVRIEWHLTADNNYGPEIPCMPAILVAKKLMQGKLTARGAMPSMGLITLDEFSPEFARWAIRTQIKETVF